LGADSHLNNLLLDYAEEALSSRAIPNKSVRFLGHRHPRRLVPAQFMRHAGLCAEGPIRRRRDRSDRLLDTELHRLQTANVESPQAFCGEKLAVRPLDRDGRYGIFFANWQVGSNRVYAPPNCQ
jgi:hypothetical protein